MRIIQKVRGFLSPAPMTRVEQWAMRNSNIATPESIITAAIIQSIAKNFDDWEESSLSDKPIRNRYHSDRPRTGPRLHNSKKNITVSFGRKQWEKRKTEDGYTMIKHTYYYDHWSYEGTKVGDVEIGPSDARAIFQAWNGMARKISAAKQAAKQAEDRMNKNEKAWNLAEDLLGMKRNEFGALVPKVTVEDENSDSDSVEMQKEEA